MPRLLVDISPLRTNREFRFLYSGQMISLLGSNLTVVAVPYQVYSQTHSSLWVGLASLIQLPFLITGALWGGAMGDRVDKRTLMLLSAVILGLDERRPGDQRARPRPPSRRPLVTRRALGRLRGLLRTAAHRGHPQDGRPEQLVAAYSLNQVAMNAAVVIGPAVAGVLDRQRRTVLVLRHRRDHVLRLDPAHDSAWLDARAAEHAGTAMFRAIGDGFRYVRSHAVVQAVYLVDLNAMVFGLPRALFPAVALTLYHGGPKTLGLLYAAPGAGALLMAVVTGWIARVRRQGRFVALGRDGLGRVNGALRTGPRRLRGIDLSRRRRRDGRHLDRVAQHHLAERHHG